MIEKNSKFAKKVLVSTHIYLNKDDWKATIKLAKKHGLNGADLVRLWMRKALEKEGLK